MKPSTRSSSSDKWLKSKFGSLSPASARTEGGNLLPLHSTATANYIEFGDNLPLPGFHNRMAWPSVRIDISTRPCVLYFTTPIFRHLSRKKQFEQPTTLATEDHIRLFIVLLHERFTSTKPNISHLRVFGSTAYIHVQKRTKLEPKSKILILVGYDEQTKAYRTLDYDRRKIVISRDALFDETTIGLPKDKYTPSGDDDIFRTFVRQNSFSDFSENPSPANLQPLLPMSTPRPLPNPMSLSPDPVEYHFPDCFQSILPPSSPILPNLSLSLANPIDQTLPPRRSQRFRKQSVRLDDYVLSVTPQDFNLCIAEYPIDQPTDDQLTVHEALRHSGWHNAMKDELLSIRKNQTYDLVVLPPGKHPISSKWVFKTKLGINGQPPRLKARLVARGFEQRHGIDFDEVFAPVVKWSTIKTLAARFALYNHKIHHHDVRTAFLYGTLEDEVYMA
jgi:predicted nucleotidyltransferase